MIEDVVHHFTNVQVLINQHDRVQLQFFGSWMGLIAATLDTFPRYMSRFWKQYDGALVQVVEVYSGDSDSPTKCQKFHRNHGLAVGLIISSLEPCCPVTKKQKTTTSTLKSTNDKGVANWTVGSKKVNETPD